MKQTLKGCLSSALVCPGVGHLALRAPKRGVLFIILSVACVILVMSALIPLVQDLVNEIGPAPSLTDIGSLHAEVHQQVMNSDLSRVVLGIRILIGIWIIALIDVFFLGRKRDRQLQTDLPE